MKTRIFLVTFAASLLFPWPAFSQCPEKCTGNTSYLTSFGQYALGQNADGTFNTAFGALALAYNTEGGGNTAVGAMALWMNAAGADNTAIGTAALSTAVYSTNNTAIGSGAMADATAGFGCVAVGVGALGKNGDATNTAVGAYALDNTSSGYQNVGIGDGALSFNATGTFNTAVGSNALAYNVESQNTAVGHYAIYGFTTGTRNTAVGDSALLGNSIAPLSTGSSNTASGASALYADTTGSDNVACGDSALINNTTGSRNIAIGQGAGTNVTVGNDNIDIASLGAKMDDSVIRIGDNSTQKRTFIAGIGRATVADGTPVVVNSKGQLGVATSSARFKRDIQPMAKSSEAILSLQPVTFRYKEELDSLGVPQFGLVAEQVAKVDPDLVAKDASGKPFTVRYEAVNAMLLNEFLKEHRKVEEQAREIDSLQRKAGAVAELKEQMAQLQAAFKAQAEQLRKVSAAVQTSGANPRLVASGAAAGQ